MSDEIIRHAYRTCPCFSFDVEGIQTWLEDMAAQGKRFGDHVRTSSWRVRSSSPAQRRCSASQRRTRR